MCIKGTVAHGVGEPLLTPISLNDEDSIMKLVALYKQPQDVEMFEAWYAEHTDLVMKIPGLSKVSLTRYKKVLAGDGFYLMAELHFPDRDTFNTAMRSAEMAETGKDANRNAGHLMTLMIAKPAEDHTPHQPLADAAPGVNIQIGS